MKQVLFLIILLIITNSCINSNRKISNNNTTIKSKIVIDTVFVSGKAFVNFNEINDNIGYISWGIKNGFVKKYKDTLHKYSVEKNRFKKINNYIIYNGSCGSACFYSILFPLNQNNEVKYLPYPLYSNTKKGIIVYKGDKSNVLVEIFNVNNNTIHEIKEEHLYTIPPVNSIDTIYVRNNNLIIKWYISENKINKKEVPLSSL